MSDITKIDKNFEVKSESGDGLEYYNTLSAPFSTHGLLHDGVMYRRIPEDVAKRVSPGVEGVHKHTSGGRVRFVTNSRRVGFVAKMHSAWSLNNEAAAGSKGFDLYERVDGKIRFLKGLVPPQNMDGGYGTVIDFGTSEKRELIFNFPQYAGVYSFEVGIENGAELEAPTPYKISTPIVFYGSSITQGACATRPGNSYENFVSRELDCDYINLGFSGNAKAEPAIAEYVAGLDMSVFVYDYDYNAPDVEYLKRTHEPMFKTVRAAHPNLPVIIMSRPVPTPNTERVAVIRQTYENALKAGDKNVYLITGEELTEISGYDTTVDNVHPTDLGFYSMSRAIIEVLKNIL